MFTADVSPEYVLCLLYSRPMNNTLLKNYAVCADRPLCAIGSGDISGDVGIDSERLLGVGGPKDAGNCPESAAKLCCPTSSMLRRQDECGQTASCVEMAVNRWEK